MGDTSLWPVVAVDLDGVLRIPNAEDGREFRRNVRETPITMSRTAFPSYSHAEPAWDDSGQWTATHTFSEVGAAWVRDLAAAGATLIWASAWQAYVNVYFAPAFDLPQLSFIDVDEDRGIVDDDRIVTQLTRQFRRRPLLWVTATASPETVAAMRKLRGQSDSARTRVVIPDSYVGVSDTDVIAMNDWLDMTRSREGQDELRFLAEQRVTRRLAVVRRDGWGTDARYRRWRSARYILGSPLGERSTLRSVLADYALEAGDDIDPDDVAELRRQWGEDVDPPAEVLSALLTPPVIAPSVRELPSWSGSGYPDVLQKFFSRGRPGLPLDVGRGWWPLLGRLEAQLAHLDPDYVIRGVWAEKGRLQVDAQSTEPRWYARAFRERIVEAQGLSAHTCERCGEPGRWRPDAGTRGHVLCDEHARPLTDDEIASAIDGGVPPDVFTVDGAVEGSLYTAPPASKEEP